MWRSARRRPERGLAPLVRGRAAEALAFAGAAVALSACIVPAGQASRPTPRAAIAQPRAATAPTATPSASPPASSSAPVRDDASLAEVPPTDELVPLAVPTSIEDPSGHALAAFHAALQRAEAGTGQARIAYYGASHVASDMYTGVIRERLQARFGGAGPGFVLPAKPWRWYVHAGIDIARTKGFKTLRVTAKDPRDDIYGYAGVALDTDPKRATSARIDLKGKPTREYEVEVRVLGQPGGGHVSIRTDVRPEWDRFPTHATEHHILGLGNVFGCADNCPPRTGPRWIEIRTHGDGPVRLFGVAIDGGPGVVLDTLGVPGARAHDQLHWNEKGLLADLAWRHPDLVVLAYGTNESGDDVPIAEEEARVDAVVKRMRMATPWASCLLVGPSDRPLKLPDGTYEPRPRTDEIIDMQRRLARAHGCGFFDVAAFMGGPLSMLRWTATTPPLGGRDLVHFTRAGYERLGHVLHDALLEGYVPAAAVAPAAPTTPVAPAAPVPPVAQ